MSELLSAYVDDPCLQGLIEEFGENFERMERFEKFLIVATTTTHFADSYSGNIPDSFSEAYWNNSVLFSIADFVPCCSRVHFNGLGKLGETKLLKLCEFLLTDLIASERVVPRRKTQKDCLDYILRHKAKFQDFFESPSKTLQWAERHSCWMGHAPDDWDAILRNLQGFYPDVLKLPPVVEA